MQFFIVIFTGLEDAFIRTLLFLVPFCASSFLAYLGMRKFARIMAVKSIWNSVIFMIITALAAAGLATLIPLPEKLIAEGGLDEPTFDMISAVLVWNGTLSLGAGMVALFARRSISQMYKKAMAWLTAALFTLAFAAVHELIVEAYLFDTFYVLSDVSSWPFILAGVLFLRAGLEFHAIQLHQLQLSDDTSDIDIVTATANLVSRPADIDKELDKLRTITARVSSVKQLSAQDKTTLQKLYLYLEEYLTTREPLAKFDKESLRVNLPRDFISKLPG